jgi:hypothetical protein
MPEKIAMPAQHGVRLYNDQCLFPPAQLACQEDDECPITPGERLRVRERELSTGLSFARWGRVIWRSSTMCNELLTKQGILYHEL